MVAVPADTPDMMPVPVPILAIAVALLLQLPPVVPSVSVVVKPTHTALDPAMAAGNGLTVTVAVEKHPVGNV